MLSFVVSSSGIVKEWRYWRITMVWWFKKYLNSHVYIWLWLFKWQKVTIYINVAGLLFTVFWIMMGLFIKIWTTCLSWQDVDPHHPALIQTAFSTHLCCSPAVSDPRCHLPMLYIGLEYGLTNNSKLAERFFSQALSIAPEDPFVMHEVAVVAFQNGEWVMFILLHTLAPSMHVHGCTLPLNVIYCDILWSATNCDQIVHLLFQLEDGREIVPRCNGKDQSHWKWGSCLHLLKKMMFLCHYSMCSFSCVISGYGG